jgi:regulator of RNase E activity RraB
MSDDRAALAELYQASEPGKSHVVRHYLYFPTEDGAAEVASRLKISGFMTEQRLGADGVNWLVLARHEVVVSEELIEATRLMMVVLAEKVGGEYDGWEAEVRR